MGEPIVAVDGLWKVFGGVTAVRDLSFTVDRGQVYGLLGPNGAGKTTTLRVLMGLERPTRGETRLFGMPVLPGCDTILRVGAMVEEAAFVPHLSGMRNLRLWWEARGCTDGRRRSRRRARHRRTGRRDRPPGSHVHPGHEAAPRVRSAAASRPELLVLDEPTNGLDPGEIREIRELIGRLSSQGATVLLSSHHLSEVEQVCNHVLVMNRGRLVANGTVAN